MAQTEGIEAADLYWAELDKQLSARHIKVQQKAKNINRLIEDLIQDYKYVHDAQKSVVLMKKIEKAIEVLFDNIPANNLDQNDQELLTEICRKFNEDLSLQKLREMSSKTDLMPAETKPSPLKNKQPLAYENAFISPRKLNSFNKVEAKSLEETVIFSHEDYSVIVEQDINIQELLNEGSEQNLLTKQLEAQALQQKIKIEKEKEHMTELINKIKEEMTENRIDYAYEFYMELVRYKDEDNLKGDALNFYNFKMQEYKEFFEDVKRTYEDCRMILKELEDEQGYTVETVKKGFTVKYKAPPGELISLKMEGELDVPLFNMIALIYEMQGYTEWMPFCKTVKEMKQTSRTAKIGYLKFNLPMPLSDRETYVHGAGFDRLKKDGSVFVAARSIHDDPEIIAKYELDIPDKSKATRVDVKYMGSSLYPLSKNKIRFSMVSKFDLKLKFLPISMINWFARKAASFLIEKIIKRANNLEGTMWEKQIKENREFYGWFEAKLDKFLAEKELKDKEAKK